MKNKKGQIVLDQTVNRSGRSRQISVGKLLPADWEWVRVVRTRFNDKTVWLRIELSAIAEDK